MWNTHTVQYKINTHKKVDISITKISPKQRGVQFNMSNIPYVLKISVQLDLEGNVNKETNNIFFKNQA